MTDFPIDPHAAPLGFVVNPQTGTGAATGGNTPLICSDERHAAKVADLEQRIKTLEHVAAGNKRHVQLIVPDLERAEAALARVRALADRWDRDAPPPGNRPLTELRAALAEPAPGPAATEATKPRSTMETCACCGGGPMLPQTGNRTSDGRALCIPCAKGTCGCARTARQRWADRGPGYDLAAHPVTPDTEATAIARAVQAAAGGERPAAWSTKHCAPDARTDQLQQRIHELESHARDADRLRTDWTAMRDRAEQAEQRAEEAEAKVREYEHMLNWHTTCPNCARTLDSCYAETMRAETAEQQRDQYAATLRQVLDAFEAYWARASYCGHGEAAVQPEHFQAWRSTLTPQKEPTP